MEQMWISNTTLVCVEPHWTRSSSVWVSGQEDHWEPEGSGVQGEAAEAHSGKRASWGGSMSARLAFILQADKWSRCHRGR